MFPATNVSEPRFHVYVQSREFLSVYLVAIWGKYTRVLSYLARNGSSKQDQAEHVFTMAQISAGLLRADTANETT